MDSSSLVSKGWKYLLAFALLVFSWVHLTRAGQIRISGHDGVRGAQVTFNEHPIMAESDGRQKLSMYCIFFVIYLRLIS